MYKRIEKKPSMANYSHILGKKDPFGRGNTQMWHVFKFRLGCIEKSYRNGSTVTSWIRG